MTDPADWVVDTSVYTHLGRAGHLGLLRDVSPSGRILLPSDVAAEIEAGRDLHPGITAVPSVTWGAADRTG